MYTWICSAGREASTWSHVVISPAKILRMVSVDMSSIVDARGFSAFTETVSASLATSYSL